MKIYIAIHEWEDVNTRELSYEICGVFNNDKYFIQEDNIEEENYKNV